jgi:hypothetical protein
MRAPFRVLGTKALSTSAHCGKEPTVADDKTKKAEDLELSESKAGEVKGGRVEGGGGSGSPGRATAVHKSRKRRGSTAKPLHGSMGHE